MKRLFEQLEPRQLLSGDVSALADVRIRDIGLIQLFYPVTVNGTPGDDRITISRDGLGSVSVNNNGAVSTYPEWRVTKFVVNAFGGNDTVNASNSNTAIEAHGGRGDDAVYGSTRGDLITGGGERDSLYGNGGDDNIDGGVGGFAYYAENTGNDYISGGDGRDTLNASDAGNNTMYGGNGDDLMYGWGGGDTMYGDFGNDVMYGYIGNDTINGGYGADFIYGQDGDDALDGGGDDDVLYAGWGNDTARGGSGNDRLYGEGNDDNLYGDSGADNLYGQNGEDNLYGGGDNDNLDGGWGDDGLFGGGGTDTLTGSYGDDRFLDRTWEDQILFFKLRRWQDNVTDLASNDARLGFQNAPQQTKTFSGQNGSYTFAAGNWTDAEIETLDAAFEELHEATFNTRLLKRSNGDNQVFYRAGALISSSGGSFSAAAWNSGGSVTFVNPGRGTLIHEMGHNWDEEYNASGWRAQSGWTNQPLWRLFGVPAGYTRGGDASGNWYHFTSAGFVSGYARTNPNEDFADTFRAFFSNRAGWSSTTIPAGKFAFMQNMVNTLA